MDGFCEKLFEDSRMQMVPCDRIGYRYRDAKGKMVILCDRCAEEKFCRRCGHQVVYAYTVTHGNDVYCGCGGVSDSKYKKDLRLRVMASFGV